MKTLIKRPNYTLSIKTSCYSAFSFYTFFRTDRIFALLSGLTVRTNSFPLINLLSFPTEAFYFALSTATPVASLPDYTNSFTDRTYFRLIYRRE